MFWIGLIVGIVVGAVVLYLLSRGLMAVVFGSYEKYSEGFGLLLTASGNRESTVQVWHDGDCLDEVIFEEE